jgi:hypothetical protein
MMRTASKQKFPPKMKMTTDIPPEITTPGTVETRLGTLKFFDGLPDKAAVEKVYDNLDFMRGLEVFLNTMAAASTLANVEGNRVDAKTLLLTPNTQTATLWSYINLRDGPIVEIPPGVLGMADDLWMRYIVVLGLAGPDKEEPADSADPEILGQPAAIGIVKGKPFVPDARIQTAR